MSDPFSEAPGEAWRPLPRGLVVLVLFVTGVELLLAAADRGFLLDPSLRARVYIVGAFWRPLLFGGDPVFA